MFRFALTLVAMGIIFSASQGSELQHQVLPKTREDIHILFQEVGLRLSSSLRSCSERIWEDGAWADFDVLLQSDLTEPRLWSYRTGEMKILDPEEVPRFTRSYLYTFPKIRGRRTVSIFYSSRKHRDMDAARLFRLVVHEGFHRYGQKGWKLRLTARGTPYPVDHHPRYQRKMSYDHLLKFIRDERWENLAQAAWWHQIWMKQHPKELESSMDGLEGTAHFVDHLSAIVSERGCQASDEQLYQSFKDSLETKYQWKLGPSHFGLDSEGYAFGAVASFFLRFQGLDQDWISKIKKGITPNQVLFQGTLGREDGRDVPEPQGNHQVELQYEQLAQERNSELGRLFAPILAHFHDRDFIRVVLPVGSILGYATHGFYIPTALPGMTLVPMARALSFQGKEWKLQSKDQSVFLSMETPVCESNGFVAVVPRTAFSDLSSQVRIESPQLIGKMSGELKRDLQGFEWFCGQI